MKRMTAFCLVLCLAAGCLAGCTVGPGTGQSGAKGQAGAAVSASAATVVASGGLRIFLPADKPALAQVIRQMAQAEEIAVELQIGAGGLAYQGTLADALAGEDAPVLFWVDGLAEARALQEKGIQFEDLSGQAAAPALRSLTAMVPEAFALAGADDEGVLGMPLGYYGEGMLVNLSLLGTLLGTQNTEMLRRDLMECSWGEWVALVTMLEDYLQQPRRLRIEIGNGTYTTPGYRPADAQKLRGMFAVATGAPEEYVNGALGATLGIPYASPQALDAATPQEVINALATALPSLFEWLDFETLHMASDNGSFAHGEGYDTKPKYTVDEAVQMFREGTALFLRADTKTGLALEAESDTLKMNLALLPLKLPPAETGETQETTSSAAQSQSETTASAPTAAEQAAASTEENNRLLNVRADGYLCIRGGADETGQAAAILIRLFASDEGNAAIAGELYLLPPATPYPAGTLAYQLSAAITARQVHPIVAAPAYLAGAQSTIGEWVQEHLMGKEEWEASDEKAFETVARSALRLPL